ncbi:AVN_collapsed_G0004890.mRNA.1.CDS.1 [Saccharomyces cerevisiae]|nr:AVN_collapsed_G0004890.mRNA.1.CDS.1 [Saccharomyces cerevisiae]
MPHSLALVYWYGIRTRMLQYIPLSNLPYSHIPLHGPSLTISTKCTHIIMHGTCLSGLYPVPFTHNAHDYPHFNIYISFGGPKYCITALNTYVTPLLHRMLTTQFIYTYANITKKSPPKSPKHKNILPFNFTK